MKKNIFFYLFFLTVLWAKTPDLSIQYLCSNSWGPEVNCYFDSYKIEFNENHEFETSFLTTTCGVYVIKGIYEIRNNFLILKRMENGFEWRDEGYNRNEKKEYKILRYTLKKSDKSCHYIYYLSLENQKKAYSIDDREFNSFIQIWNLNSKVSENTKRSINNIDMIILKERKAYVIKNTQAKEFPDIKSRYYIFSQLGCDKDFSYIQKGDTVTVIGRTLEKDKVGEWENYWYFIDYMSNGMKLEGQGRVSPISMWVFGNFLDIKND